ncbi:MAG: GTPase ObgE [Candidatus Kerfeldbacteria bacterium]|nr:GTPase ObgE [Candidatus Kerfeldbacteria bacterium]
MAFIDELTLELKAGDGGDGVVRWRREKFVPKGGPAGGNGGQGGDVYLEAVSDITMLARYKGKKRLVAADGGDGGSAQKHGQNGADLVVQVPVGSFVRNQNTTQEFDLTNKEQRLLVLRGGRGGRGNVAFKSPTRTAPDFSTDGQPGQAGTFVIELRLVVDVGLIGLPNAGKSSLLNELTAARAKIGAYPFTTLEPNLGMLDGLILADIPGLIEGAARGKGLGTKFLRHIERTRLLAHCVSIEHQNVRQAYHTVRRELRAYGRGLDQKSEIIILTKTDLATTEQVVTAGRALAAVNPRILTCSIHDHESLLALTTELQRGARSSVRL